MRSHLLAATAAVGLCAAGVGGALGQFSSAKENRWMTVKNLSKYTADNIHIIPSMSDCCWSRDLLPYNARIDPDYSLSVNFDDGSGTCTFDIRVTSEEGTDWHFDHVDVCLHVEMTLKGDANDGKDNRVTVKNDSDLTASSIYIIPSQEHCCWSDDLLGGEVIPNGGSLALNFDDGSGTCTFDVRITSSDSRKDWNFNRVNVCSEKKNGEKKSSEKKSSKKKNSNRKDTDKKIILTDALAKSSSDVKERAMTVNNKSNFRAHSIHIIPSTTDCCWSHNLLTRDDIMQRQTLFFPLYFDHRSPECVFDLRVISRDKGREWNFDGLDVCGEKREITLK